ncbi:17330_t:CDS:2 [Gigaspora margarita]|uniref:17330_t:CDS:1 n=1 Tax=Gigaspora margarita TaxID=4874 RepID=A0ABN7UKT6_GIGMA|nr:17330_t:CDS:2 [Gigaspora margarita]
MYFEDPTWHHGGDLVVSWNCHRTSRMLKRQYVCQFLSVPSVPSKNKVLENSKLS